MNTKVLLDLDLDQSRADGVADTAAMEASAGAVISLPETSSSRELRKVALVEQMLEYLTPQFSGSVLLYLPPEYKSSKREIEREILDLGVGTSQLTVRCGDSDSLDWDLADRDHTLVIEKAPTEGVSITKTHGKLLHVPRILSLRSFDGLPELLSSPASWRSFSQRTTLANRVYESDGRNFYVDRHKEVEEQFESIRVSRIVRGPYGGFGDGEEVLSSVEASSGLQRIELTPEDLWERKEGFASSYSKDDLKRLIEYSGAQLIAVSQQNKLLGYYLFFTDPYSLPQRGHELREAVRLSGAEEADGNVGYCKMMEITQVGKTFSKLHQESLYAIMHEAMAREARLAGLDCMVGECRAFPHPNRVGVAAHANHGWISSSAKLLYPVARLGQAIGGVYYLPLVGDMMRPIAKRSEYLQWHELNYQVVDRAVGLNADTVERLKQNPNRTDLVNSSFCVLNFSGRERVEIVDTFLPKDQDRAVVWIGSPKESRELVFFRRKGDEIEVERRVWDVDNSAAVSMETNSMSKGGTPNWGAHMQLDKALVLSMLYGVKSEL